MIWKVFVPHEWPEPSAVWEDIYLLPELSPVGTPSIWLTVDALGFFDAESEANGGPSRADAIAKLAGREFVVDGADMIVAVERFSRPELLHWATVWLRESGFQVTALREASCEEFYGSNQHSTIIGALAPRTRA